MSYILDALRRADAERERSEAPDLHARHLDATLDDDRDAPEPRRWRLLAIAGALGVAAALAWYVVGREPTAVPSRPAPQAMAVADEPAPVAPLRAAPTAAPAPTPTPLAAPAPAPADVPAPPPVVVANLPPIPQPEPASAPAAVVRPARVAASAAAAAPSAAAPSAPVAEARIPTQAELPDELRREIPALVVGGAMYSPTPANRMLILNGQVMHEGDQPAAGLVLEQINLKTAVLRYKGQRFRIAY